MSKVCTGCKQDKPKELFYSRYLTSGNLSLTSKCRDCHNEYMAQWRTKNPNRRDDWIKNNPARFKVLTRRYMLKSKYGLSELEFNELLNKQDNACAICKTVFDKTPCVDHCHDTGKVRGLLCNNCNRCLGLLKDSVEVLQGAINYLKEYKD